MDPHAGRISLFRVYSGTLKSDSAVHNASRDVAERVGSLLLLQGKAQTQVPEIQAGDIGAVAKLKDTQTGDTLADKASPIVYPPVVFPEPATTFAIEPKTRGDDDKISTALQRLLEEDPVLRVSRDAQTHEMLLSGHGPAPHRGGRRAACASATRSRSTSRSPRSPTGRRSRARPRRTGATRSRRAATASSATAGSA